MKLVIIILIAVLAVSYLGARDSGYDVPDNAIVFEDGSYRGCIPGALCDDEVKP